MANICPPGYFGTEARADIKQSVTTCNVKRSSRGLLVGAVLSMEGRMGGEVDVAGQSSIAFDNAGVGT